MGAPCSNEFGPAIAKAGAGERMTASHPTEPIPTDIAERPEWGDCVEKLLSRIEIDILIRRRPGNSNKRSNLMRLRNNNIGIGPLLSGH